MVALLFSVESDESRSPQLSAQRATNFFTEHMRPDAKSQVPMFGAPGIKRFATCGSLPCRGRWIMGGLLYVVAGTSLYSVDLVSGVSTLIGTGIGGTAPVGISGNGTQLIIVNGPAGGGWIYTVALGLVPITDPNFFPADGVLFFDDYFVLNRSGTRNWFLSTLLDGMSYPAIYFGTTESTPSDLIWIAENNELLYLAKRDRIEMWYDAANPTGFPFGRYTGGVIERGTGSAYATVKEDNAVFFLGDDLVYYRLQGNAPKRISTHWVETVIAREPDPSLISGFTWNIEGHKFIVLTLPGSGRTLAHDLSTGNWHDRESRDANGVSYGRWRVQGAVWAYSKTLFIDGIDGSVGEPDWDLSTEYGNAMVGVLRSLPIYDADRKWVTINRLEFDFQAGVGNSSGQGSDPQIMLRWSKDGGMTWSTAQRFASWGAIGKYVQRARWQTFGRALSWVFELTVSDPIRRTIIAASYDSEVGL